MSAMPTDYIAEAIAEAYGERCPEYAEGCACCEAWKKYDALTSTTPPDVAGLIAELEAFATGCRGSMWQSREETIRLCEQAATALRLSAGGGVPSGWKLVPVEPTEEMIGEGDRVMYGRYGCSFEVAPIYDAMLAASPTVEAGHVE